MALNAKNAPRAGGGGNRVEQPLLEVGPYPGRIVQVIDLGVQAQNPYEGKEKPPAHMLMLTYELLDAFMVDEDGKELEDKPRWIGEDFALHNLEADLAKSTKRYMALDPDMDFDGDFTRLINLPCTITIGHNKGKGKNAGRTYEKIMNVSGMRAKEAAKAAELVNKPKVFELDEPDMEVFNALPAWIQEKIKGNLNFAGSALEQKLKGGNSKAKKQDKPAEDEDGEW